MSVELGNHENSAELTSCGDATTVKLLNVKEEQVLKQQRLSEETCGREEEVDEDDMMVGVHIFEEEDVDTETEHKLSVNLYSDVEGDLGADSDGGGLLGDHGNDVEREMAKGGKKKKRKGVNREPSRLTLEERIKCIRLCSRYSSYADAQKAWRQAYDTEPPCRKTLSTIDKKFQRTGSVADLVRTGRPKSTRTEQVIARVEEAISNDPSKSIRTLAKELGIHQASVHRIKKEFEDKRNTLKMENRKLRDRLNEALKRIVLLEKRLTRSQAAVEEAEAAAALPEPKYETLVLAAPDGISTTGLTSFSTDSLLESHAGSSIPTIITLSNANSQVLRLPQGQETIHIITLPTTTSQSQQHHVLSLDETSFQLSIPSTSSSNNSTISPVTVSADTIPTTVAGTGGMVYLTSTASTSTSSNNTNLQDNSSVAASFVSFK